MIKNTNLPVHAPRVRDYVSDRVFDGKRPLSVALAKRMRKVTKEARKRLDGDAEGQQTGCPNSNCSPDACGCYPS